MLRADGAGGQARTGCRKMPPFLQTVKEGLGGIRELVSTELFLHGSHYDSFHSAILLLRKAEI